MADLETPVQVGFAEFIARLMSEVFDSVITTQVDQEERYARMVTSAALTEEEYADLHIGDDEAAEETALLFPPRSGIDKEQETCLYAGSPYFPAKGDQEENPPFLSVLGMSLEKADLEKGEKGPILTQTGADRILDRIRLNLASRHLGIVRQIMARGLPRVLVDSGRINGKLTFHLTETTQETDSQTPGDLSAAPARDLSSLSRASLGTTGIKSVFTLPKARILPNVKLMVKQADDTSPQSTQVKANVYGEVEITFKTVT
ncbi:hypothetical protein [Desulfospira joergensenii]|uniref:hypothetical protein n=1 Tax=Desulfospira joergensenii TaxID=53329 RepID=UPI0003B645B1|nr:hypothetical protein [Desulfospira joergensenii]